MASRLAPPRLPRLTIDLEPREWLEMGRRGLAWRPPRGTALRRALWRTATLPYWIGSDVPAPQLPARDAPPPPAGLAGDQVARIVGEIGRRVWTQRVLTILARSSWLGMLIGCFWLIVEIEGGPELDLHLLVWIAAAVAAPGVIFAALVRPTRRQVARMLDRSFHLQERMTTAVENLGKNVPQDGERAVLVYLQMADAANVVGELRRYPTFSLRPPVRELVIAIACALVFASLFFLRGVGGDIPPLQAGAVPRFTPASERMAQPQNQAAPTGAQADTPTTAEVQQRAERSNQARQDLEALAKALADHGVTNAAANAIERGDYTAAADELRNLAEDADQLSPATREDLAQNLDRAASQMSDGSQDLADATRQAADGLRQGDTAAEDGMRNLGDAVERTGNEVASQQELAEQMRQAQAAEQSQSGSNDSSQNSSDSSSSDQSSSQSGGQQDGAGQQSEAGDGANAQPGNSGQSAEPGQNQDGSQGEQSAAGQRQADAGQNGEPGAAQQPGEEGGSQSAEGGQPGEAGQPENPQEGQSGQPGAGAGSGPDDGTSQQGQAQPGAEAQQPAEGESPDPNVVEGNGQGGQGEGKGAESDPREAITLSRAPSGETIQTSSDSGGSMAGSGPGASVRPGTSTQGDVGASGPDSNRVPPSYRTIVENYFSDPEGS